jgi:hypothetical protein
MVIFGNSGSAYDPEHEGSETVMQLEREIDPNFPKGCFSGRVVCASTGLPLAAAAIKLQAVKEERDIRFGIQKLGVTDAEGNFDFPNILASTYYAFATLPGYASPSCTLARSADFGIPTHLEAPRQVLDAVLHKITVTPGTPSQITFSLEPAGSISGTVSWLDGSPAINNPLKVRFIDGEKNQHDHWLTPVEDTLGAAFLDEPKVLTDSNGNFKLAGLFTGNYIVGAGVPRLLSYVRKNLLWDGVPPTINCASLFYWTGNTPNLADAIPVDVESGTDISNIDLVLPMLPMKP